MSRSVVRRRAGWVAFGLYLGFVLVVTLRPDFNESGIGGFAQGILRVLHSWGIPLWFDYSALEFTANVGFFAPLGLLLGALLPWRVGALLAGALALPALSATIETIQGLFLPARVADVRDVVANSIGALAAYALVVMARRATRRASRKRA